jgi:hypothetical protein
MLSSIKGILCNNLVKCRALRASYPSRAGKNKLAFRKALKINPYLIDVRYHYAKFLEENGHTIEALGILWAGWGLVINSPYQKGVDYLLFQLEMNNKYGKPEGSLMIEQLIPQIKKRYCSAISE